VSSWWVWESCLCVRVELEATVAALQEENKKLQERLQILRTTQPTFPGNMTNATLVNPTLNTAPQQDTTSTEPQPLPGLGIDYAYLVKIQKELTASKTALTERSLDISNIQGKEELYMDESRKEMLNANARLSSLKAEWGGLGVLLEMLKAEREGLGKQEEMLDEVMSRRRNEGDVGGNLVGGGAEGEVEEMGRLVDAASNGWTVSRCEENCWGVLMRS
jgi:hypothetical protein